MGSIQEENESLRKRVSDWVLLEGDRRVVAGAIVVWFIGSIGFLIWADVLAVGVSSSAPNLFGSGLTAGVVTVVTITLSINQLILSRVFGTPDVLSDRLNGARDLRQNVETLARKPSSPTDPSRFLSMIATTLSDRASDLLSMSDSTDWQPPAEVTDALHDFVSYGRSIDDSLGEDTTATDILSVVLGTEYAQNMAAAHHLLNKYEASLPEDAKSELEAIDELLESVAIVRQFYKTTTLQQDFAALARQIVYSGLIALLAAVSITLLYRTNSVTLSVSILPFVVSLGVGVTAAPVALLVAYILRAATIARRTVSVGPFIPPQEQ
ncbi:MAG: hypothetical protein ACQETI_14905 [Halobacteriota archaeon]